MSVLCEGGVHVLPTVRKTVEQSTCMVEQVFDSHRAGRKGSLADGAVLEHRRDRHRGELRDIVFHRRTKVQFPLLC